MHTFCTQECVFFSFLKEAASFDELHVCFPPLLMLELTVLGQFPVIALSKDYYYRELIASCQSHRKTAVRKAILSLMN